LLGPTDGLAGDVMLFWRSCTHAGGELGYVFNPVFGGRGYATDAASAMLQLGFEGLGPHRASHHCADRRAQQTAGAAGPAAGHAAGGPPGAQRVFKGDWSTELDFAMLAEESQARRNGAAGSQA